MAISLQFSRLATTRWRLPRIRNPEVDLGGSRELVIEEVKRAAGSMGFFQVVNHGIPLQVLEELLRKARGFHELPDEKKRVYYSRGAGRKVQYTSNFDLYKSRSANWRDTMFCVMGPEPLDPSELPEICRDIIVEYTERLKRVGTALFELLFEGKLKEDAVLFIFLMTFGQQNTENEAHDILNYAFTNGINVLDTAEAYPIPMSKETQGRTDRYIGSWLNSQTRDKVILATKVSGYSQMTTYLRENGKLLRVDAANVKKSVEMSLQRRGTDYIDLLQIHWPDR